MLCGQHSVNALQLLLVLLIYKNKQQKHGVHSALSCQVVTCKHTGMPINFAFIKKSNSLKRLSSNAVKVREIMCDV